MQQASTNRQRVCAVKEHRRVPGVGPPGEWGDNAPKSHTPQWLTSKGFSGHDLGQRSLEKMVVIDQRPLRSYQQALGTISSGPQRFFPSQESCLLKNTLILYAQGFIWSIWRS